MALRLRLRLWLARAQNHTWEGKSSNEILFHELYTTILVSNNSKWLFGLSYFFLPMLLCLVRVPSPFGQSCQLPQSRPCSSPHSCPIFLLLSIFTLPTVTISIFLFPTKRYAYSSFRYCHDLRTPDSIMSSSAESRALGQAITQLKTDARFYLILSFIFGVFNLGIATTGEAAPFPKHWQHKS